MSEHGARFLSRVVDGDLGLFIDGKLLSGSGQAIDLVAPASGQRLGSLSAASPSQLDDAVTSARAAFTDGDWSSDAQMRARVLRTLADVVEAHAEEIAHLDAVEAGKTVTGSMTEDVPDVVANLRYFADLAVHDDGRYLQDGSGWGWVRRIPLGVVGAVLPWNYPIAMLGWKVAPALAAGNTVILKPSEDSTLSALLFAELAVQAGVPAGVLSVLSGDGPGVGAAIGLYPDIDMVTFTGSGEVGRAFLEYSARSNLKKVSLELGGRAAYIVDGQHTTDLTTVAEDAVGAAFGNSGQNCTATSRIVFVGDKERFSDFRSALVDAVSGITVGDPLEASTTMGPVITAEARGRIARWVEDAVARGAQIVHAHNGLPTEGHWYPPTLVEDVPGDTHLGHDEIFGPVAQLVSVGSRDEAVSLVNDEPYGLASTVWCEDINRAKWWADRIRVGTLAINGYSEGTVATPFGGLRQSGFWGRDNGPEAMAGYQEAMTVWIAST